VQHPLHGRHHLRRAGIVATLLTVSATTFGLVHGATSDPAPAATAASTGMQLDTQNLSFAGPPRPGTPAAAHAAAERLKMADRAAAQAKALVDQQAAAAAAAAQAAAARMAADEQAARDAQRDPKSAAQLMLADHGWSSSQFACLDSLWTKESGWNYQASNSSSGAFGIPQALPAKKLASAGADWRTNPVTQIRWGLQYIADTYGSPCSAWAHSRATNWY
jgi:hypothetical protein